jgi:hypothetical protein
MNKTTLSGRLRSEVQLRIDSKQLSFRNVKTSLNVVMEIGGEDSCLKLLDEAGTKELWENIVSSLKAKGKGSSSVDSAKSNLLKLANLAKELFPIAKADSISPEICTEHIKIEGHRDMILAEIITAAIKVYYKDHPNCVATGKEHWSTYAGQISMTAVKQDLSNRSGGVVSVNALSNFIQNQRMPNYNNRPRIALLERLLNVKEGIFLARCQQVPQKRKGNSKGEGKSVELVSIKELTSKVQEQWDNLSAFYKRGTVPATVPPSYLDDHSANVKMCDGATWTEKDSHASSGVLLCATEHSNWTQLRLFFGWLHLEHGVHLEDLDLSLLAQDKLVEQYKGYKVTQGAGISTANTLSAFACKIFKAQHSYGSRYHAPSKELQFRHTSKMIKVQYPKGLPYYKTSMEWAAARGVVHANLSETHAEGKKFVASHKRAKKTKGSGGVSNIRWILDDVKGVSGAVESKLWPMVNLLADWADNKVNQRHITERLGYGRTAAFAALSLIRPLRILNAACIELIEDPRGKLSTLTWESMWENKDGSYCIHIPRMRIKNGSGNEVIDINITIDKGMRGHKIMKRWLKLRAATFKKEAIESKWLFPQVSLATRGESMFRLSKTTYTVHGGSSFQQHTLRAFEALLGSEEMEILSITDGINPHAWRHIGAHFILEKTNNDYALAAHFLMDSVDMIIKTYGKNNHDFQSKKLEALLLKTA